MMHCLELDMNLDGTIATSCFKVWDDGDVVEFTQVCNGLQTKKEWMEIRQARRLWKELVGKGWKNETGK